MSITNRLFSLWILLCVVALPPFGLADQQSRAEQSKAAAVDGQLNESEQPLRLQAYYLAKAIMESNDIEDPLAAAHMRADFAGLLCAYGDRDRAREVFKKSFAEVALSLLRQETEGRDNDEGVFELAINLSRLMRRCDTSMQTSIADELDRLQIKKEGEAIVTEKEPPVVADPMWGTRPSTRRQLAAEIFMRQAYVGITQKQLAEAEKLTARALDYCVTNSLGSVLSELQNSGRSDAAARLFLKAVQQAKALPSGAEAFHLSLSFPLFEKLQTASPIAVGQSRLLEVYLDMLTALVQSPNSTLTAKSSYVVNLVERALPHYVTLRPAVKPLVAEWVFAATKRFPVPTAATVEPMPLPAESSDQQVSAMTEIALRTNDAKERDQAYASIASTHLQWAKFDAAFEAAAEISNAALKQELLDETLYRQLSFRLLKSAQLRTALTEVQKISSRPLRIKLYTRLAAFISQNDKLLAYEALEEAAKLASKLDPSAMRSHLLLGIADAYADIDRVKALVALADAIKSINGHGDQPASRWGRVLRQVSTIEFEGTGRFPRTILEDPQQYQKPYDFSFLQRLAWVDFDGLLYIADSITDKTLRTSAKYEICAGILQKSQSYKKGGAVTMSPQ